MRSRRRMLELISTKMAQRPLGPWLAPWSGASSPNTAGGPPSPSAINSRWEPVARVTRFYHCHNSTPSRNPTDREGATSDGKVPPAPPLTTTSLHCITILHRHLVHHSDTMKAGILPFSISLSSPSRSSTRTCHQCEVVPRWSTVNGLRGHNTCYCINVWFLSC
jgi:hypothetical protein